MSGVARFSTLTLPGLRPGAVVSFRPDLQGVQPTLLAGGATGSTLQVVQSVLQSDAVNITALAQTLTIYLGTVAPSADALVLSGAARLVARLGATETPIPSLHIQLWFEF